MNSHRCIHTGETRFVCPDCDKTFKQSRSLNRHRRIHAGENPFVCLGCDKNFRLKVDLIEHCKICTEEKPYACPDCDEKFKEKGELNKHYREIHTGKPLASSGCNEQLLNLSSFERHETIQTGDEPCTDEVSFVPSECNMAGRSSIIGNCAIVGEDGHGDIDKILDSTVSTENEDTDSFKLYGCGICCQSFSTKEETMHCFHSH